MQPLKIILCGRSSIQLYIEVIKECPDLFELVGLLSTQNEYIKKCVKCYDLDLYLDISQIPEAIDIAYVVAEDNLLIREKASISKEILKKDIHVIQERPIFHKDIIDCLRVAKKRNLIFMIGDLYRNLKPIILFSKCMETVLKRQKGLYIDAALDKDVLYSFLHILLKNLSIKRPFEISSSCKDIAPINTITGKIGDLPVVLRVHNRDITNNSNNYFQLLQQITIGVEGGNLLLAGSNGPIIWENSIPNGIKEFIYNDGKSPTYLYENSTEIIWEAELQSYKQILLEEQPKAIIADLKNVRNLIIEKKNITSQTQLEILCANYWSKLLALIDEQRETVSLDYKEFPSILLKKVIKEEESKRDLKSVIEFKQDLSTADEYGRELIKGITKEYLSYCVQKRNDTIFLAMLNLLQKRGLFLKSDEMYSSEEVIKAMNTAPQHKHVLLRWLEVLSEKEYLKKIGDKYGGVQQVSDQIFEDSWNQMASLWDHKLGSPLTTEYLLRNIKELPELISGEQKATFLLFPEGKLDYANALYKETLILEYLNGIISEAIIRIGNKKNIFKQDQLDTLKILEIGAGTGATTDLILSRLKKIQYDHKIEYLFTDIAKLFLKKAEARYNDFSNIEFKKIDIDQDFKVQGLNSESVDIIIAVGVLNNAYNTDRTINQMLNTLIKDGWLFILEPVIEVPEVLVSQVFMMTNPVDDRKDSKRTFLSAKQWREIFSRAGASEVLEFPDDSHPLNLLGQKLFMVRK